MLQATLPPSPRTGGVGYQVDLLARGLTGRGHDVTVFVVDDVPTSRGYRSIPVPLPQRGRAGRIFGVGRAFSRLDLTEFDVVHAHGDDWLFGRRPRVRTFYGTALMEARAATSWLRKGSQLCLYSLEWVSSLGPLTVSISERTRRYLPLVKSCIPCAFDPAIFHPGGRRTPFPSVLFVAGTLAGRKRGDLLLRAFREARAAIPQAQLTIVSRDSVDRPGVTCVSGVEGGALGDLYRNHWLLCSASSYEGFGVPYVEALASGLPVVTTENHGASEVLRGGELGVVCAPEELGPAITGLLEDEARRRCLSERGLEAVRSFALDVVLDQYETLYRRAAEAVRRSTTRKIAPVGSPDPR